MPHQNVSNDSEQPSDSYSQLKQLNYQLYRDTIMYSEIALIRAKIPSSKAAADIEGCFVGLALHILKHKNDNPEI